MSENTADTRPCPACAETIKAAATKCRFCGTDLPAHAEEQKAEVEQVIFKGHPAVIYSGYQWIPLPAVLALAFLVYLGDEDDFSMPALLTLAGGVVALLGAIYVSYWIQSLMKTFHITTQRINVECGLLSRVRKSVELFRINHVDVHKPLDMWIVGHCALKLFTSDKELEEFYLYGIANLESFAETLRECQLRERSRRKGLITVLTA